MKYVAPNRCSSACSDLFENLDERHKTIYAVIGAIALLKIWLGFVLSFWRKLSAIASWISQEHRPQDGSVPKWECTSVQFFTPALTAILTCFSLIPRQLHTSIVLLFPLWVIIDLVKNDCQ